MSQASNPAAPAASKARAASAPLIEVKNVSRAFKLGSEDVYAVKNVSMTIQRQSFVTLVGRSGSGKTTLLNLLAGLDHPTEGQILFEGKDLANLSEKEVIQMRRNRIGVVFQSFALLPLLSAYENVELPLRIAGLSARERSQRTEEALDMVGLTRRAKHRPFELSGGEQQRISIARAVGIKPDIILADEPTGELDSANAGHIFGLFQEMSHDRGMTIVATTHDRTLLDMADHIYEISDGVLAERQESGHDHDALFRKPDAH
ncbi:MAG: ABC transporter ATP-binding protein [Chloroflexi bacterium]|nr:ABC transporter ATP-binding protein [Chloroflexota bacterium]